MLSSLFSVLLLGLVEPPSPTLPPTALPGIELVTIAEPAELHGKVDMPALSASGVLLLDARSGEPLLEREADTRRPMASLTKIMTALLVLEDQSFSDVVTIPAITEYVNGSSVGLKPGEHYTVGNLFKALLIQSANDAAYVLAVHHSRTIASFVRAMNWRAMTLGLSNTRFSNPAGLDNEQQYSTPRDLAWLTLMAIKSKDFASTVRMRTAVLQSEEGERAYLRNTNEFLHQQEHVLGVKTGTTDKAGECLIALFEEGGREYLLVLPGSSDRYGDSLRVLEAVRRAHLRLSESDSGGQARSSLVHRDPTSLLELRRASTAS